jgi:hypothetical protein
VFSAKPKSILSNELLMEFLSKVNRNVGSGTDSSLMSLIF